MSGHDVPDNGVSAWRRSFEPLLTPPRRSKAENTAISVITTVVLLVLLVPVAFLIVGLSLRIFHWAAG